MEWGRGGKAKEWTAWNVGTREPGKKGRREEGSEEARKDGRMEGWKKGTGEPESGNLIGITIRIGFSDYNEGIEFFFFWFSMPGDSSEDPVPSAHPPIFVNENPGCITATTSTRRFISFRFSLFFFFRSFFFFFLSSWDPRFC